MNAAARRARRGAFAVPFWVWLVALLACIPLAMVVTGKLEAEAQLFFMVFTIVAFLVLNLFKSRAVTMVLVILSATVSTRYLYWRLTETMDFQTLAEMFLGTGLFLAELYAFVVLILGFVQSINPLRRSPTPLPEDINAWPTVDVYIPTYDESLQIVSSTVLGALSMDYPRDKMRVYLLDDGRRPEFAAFAEEAGCGYIARDNNANAKAGNLNHAFARTDSDLICIFDSDHIPTRAFLQMTVGAFLANENIALVQTPHHFYSPDPFERNINGGTAVPNEGQLFYGLIQEGNDFWNSAFFCGSCAVLRREALDDVGGFATETVTEDAHTALKMHRRGWDSIYIRLPLAAGLATERLALHIGQRMRWARGMTQIFRIDNPLFGRGLTLAQRLCYLNAMLHFFFALPRFVFLTAPLAYLLFSQNIITSSWQLIFLYAFPHLVHSVLTNSRLQSRHRYTFWGEIYESVLSFHILKPTLYTLINPRTGSFNVTEKGGLLPQGFFDSSRVVPHMVLAGFLILGLILGVLRILLNEADLQFLQQIDVGVIVLNMIWAGFNLIVVLAAISVARERRQVREHVRVPVDLATRLVFGDGEVFDTRSIDVSMGGALVEVSSSVAARVGESVRLDVSTGSEVLPVIGEIVGVRGNEMRVQFSDPSLEQQRNLVRLVFGRADAWLSWDNHRADSLWRSFGAIFRGIGGMFGSGGRNARATTTRASALALALGLGLAAMPGDVLAQSRNDGLAPPPPPPANFDNRAVLQAPLAPPPAPIGQQQFGSAVAPGSQIGVAPPVPMRPGSQQPVRGQADGVAGQLRPNEPLNAVVPNASIETYPVVLVPMDSPSVPAGPMTPALDGSLETATLRTFNVEPNMKMISVKGTRYIPFTLRADKVVDQARLTLSYDYSPSLLPELSNLSVMLNGAPIGKLRLLRSYSGGATIQLPINAALFKEENVLLLETDKHYTTECEDPVHESLWLRVNTKASKLEMAVRPLPLIDDLSILPRPFVDEYDFEPEPLTFLLPPNPSDTVLQAAGIVASYFGDVGRKHGVEINVRFGNLGTENAVVFVSGANAPSGVPVNVSGSGQISIQTNPNSRQGAKVLIIGGGDDASLLQAAQQLAIAARGAGLRGQAAQVNAPPALKDHEADDASRWISLTEPVPLATLVKQEEDLQGVGVTGFLSAPFVMPPRRLPDEQGGPTLRVEYEYPDAPFLDKNTSRFDILLSGEFVKTIPLTHSQSVEQLADAVRGDTDEEGRKVVRIDPAVLTGAKNELQFFFNLLPKLGKCTGKMPADMRFRIQRSSTIDFSDTIHYTPLPDIASFASVGYPFTRKADLSETVIMVPQNVSEDEASAFLNVMALMGEATGDPAARVTVTRPGAATGDNDVLMIGAWSGLEGQIQSWSGGGPFVYDGGQLRVKSVSPIDSMRYFLSSDDDPSDERDRANTVLSSQGQGFSGMVSFENPEASERTVVVLAGASPAETLELTKRMRDSELVDSFKGDLIKMNTKGVTSFAVGPQFTVYSIPFWQRLRWFFADRPLLLIALLVVGVALLSIILVWLLQRIAAARIQDARAD